MSYIIINLSYYITNKIITLHTNLSLNSNLFILDFKTVKCYNALIFCCMLFVFDIILFTINVWTDKELTNKLKTVPQSAANSILV